ncbi:MAG: serine hydrolase [Clostridia bacterium]|nr:serine hydrolase [Clostridia bacterium]
MDFQAFVNDIQTNRWNVFGAEVYQGGKLLHHFGDTTSHRHPIYSATKTVTSIAAGMAQDEGHIDLNRCILDYLPEIAVSAMPDAQRNAYRPITLKRLMTMSVAGYPFRAEGASWLAAALSYPLKDTQQRVFDYSNIPAYLVGVAVARAVDESLESYLERKLFRPLGIVHPITAHCPDGYFYGASGMELTVHDLSQIGLMLMHSGEYAGQRILSESYVRQATAVQQMNREGGYGYFLWKYRNGFSINGKWKQKCYVLPKEGLVITYLAHIEEDCPELKESMEKHILG